ncbi:MAG: DUF5681 domain-containing protein [Beijerinckiaceae bacterium]
MSRRKNPADENLAQIREHTIMGRTHPAPARDTRFKPGRSGNPKGRPRRSEPEALSIEQQPTKSALIRASRQKLQVREGDRIFEMDATTALVRAAQQTALKGSPYMQHRMLETIMKIEREEAGELESSRTFWADYKKCCYELLESERMARNPHTALYPHPDDVIIASSGKVSFVGPMDEAGQTALERTIAIRDLLVLQDEWDCRSRPEPRGSRDKFIGAAYLFAHALNGSLPPRLQLTNSRWFWTSERARYATTRELLKTLYRGWRALGFAYRRGHRFPDRDMAVKCLKFAFAVGQLDVQNVHEMPATQLEDMFIDLLDEQGLQQQSALNG